MILENKIAMKTDLTRNKKPLFLHVVLFMVVRNLHNEMLINDHIKFLSFVVIIP